MDKDKLKYFAEYRAKNREKLRSYNREYNKKWRAENGYHNERKWDKENPEKRKAQAIVAEAIKKGELKRPKGKNIVAHHSNYSKPKDVKWVSKSVNRKLAK